MERVVPKFNTCSSISSPTTGEPELPCLPDVPRGVERPTTNMACPLRLPHPCPAIIQFHLPGVLATFGPLPYIGTTYSSPSTCLGPSGIQSGQPVDYNPMGPTGWLGFKRTSVLKPRDSRLVILSVRFLLFQYPDPRLWIVSNLTPSFLVRILYSFYGCARGLLIYLISFERVPSATKFYFVHDTANMVHDSLGAQPLILTRMYGLIPLSPTHLRPENQLSR